MSTCSSTTGQKYEENMYGKSKTYFYVIMSLTSVSLG